MKGRAKGRLRLWIAILVMLAVAIMAGYYFGMEQGRKEAEKPVVEDRTPPKEQAPPEDAPMAKGCQSSGAMPSRAEYVR